MTERPILFSGEMVRQILRGPMHRPNKWQTRRVVKWKPREDGLNLGFSGLQAGHYCTAAGARSGFVLRSRGAGGCWNDRTHPARCPYGVAGDRLWVRETWAPGDWIYPFATFMYRADFTDYDDEKLREEYAKVTDGDGFRWRPSIFMRRRASRITLEVTRVRVERLQSISEDDARAEGVVGTMTHLCGSDDRECDGECATRAFRQLWDSINARRGYGWETSPWVWVVEFKRITP